MRPFEILLLLAVIAAALALMTKSAARWSIPFTLLGVFLCTWHVVRGGTHCQMIPALSGLMLFVIWQLIPADSSSLPLPGHEELRSLFDRTSLVGKLHQASPGTYVLSSSADWPLSRRDPNPLPAPAPVGKFKPLPRSSDKTIRSGIETCTCRYGPTSIA